RPDALANVGVALGGIGPHVITRLGALEELGLGHAASPRNKSPWRWASSMRLQAMSKKRWLFSIPTKVLPSFMAATPVVPEPMNGSIMRSAPTGRWPIAHFITPSGFCVG